ncbi:hypothetical protein Tco_1107755 [Tanacetum coccineum]
MFQRFRRHASHTELFDQEVESFSWQGFGEDVSQLVSILRRERRYFRSMDSSYERKAVIARHVRSHSESRIQAMEAQIRALLRDVDVLQRQRIRDEDRLTAHI